MKLDILHKSRLRCHGGFDFEYLLFNSGESTETPSVAASVADIMPGLADELSWVERGDVLILSGCPSDDEHEWHVNIAEHVTGGPSRRMSIVLQSSGASDHWLSIALEQRGGGAWRIDDLAAFEGRSPPGADAEGKQSIDPETIELIDIR